MSVRAPRRCSSAAPGSPQLPEAVAAAIDEILARAAAAAGLS